MDEKEIMDMVLAGYPWEQVIYKVVALEALDPWDVDIIKLSDVFIKQIARLELLDFKVPAKYIIIAAVLLRMKSDHLQFIDIEPSPEIEADGLDFDAQASAEQQLLPLLMPAKRLKPRKIVFEELIDALRRALKTEKRREENYVKARVKIEISQVDITRRIDGIYSRINNVMDQLHKDEIKFSSLLPKWNRQHVVETFLPLIYLDHEKKVECRQEEMFEEIFIKKRGQVSLGHAEKTA